MAHLNGDERAAYVQNLFTRIAPRYDLINRLMTGFQDVRWRRKVIRLARLRPGAVLLDLGTGTGDLAREALRQSPQTRVVAADFTLTMMQVGNKRYGPLPWCAADALALPFPAHTFDAVVSGFLMRNVIDLPQALREQFRVLKPGGRIVILDTTRPRPNLFSPLIRFHMHTVIPTLGKLLAGEQDAYHYLPDSTEGFLSAEELAHFLATAGFQEIGYQRLMFDTIAIHWAIKPDSPAA
jgi:demethylmenaquinone methyltransferase/2-methoxy-6-polyprenyl-1,4-benzoquinol methylase